MLERRWRPTWLVSGLALVTLAGVCFARLVVQPAALIVDGERPTIDHANPAEPRGIGNDATFSFLPHHLSIAKVIRTFGHVPSWDIRGFGGRPLIGNPQGGTFYPPVWMVWWSACCGRARMANCRTSALGRRAGMYVLMRRARGVGRWGGNGGGSLVPSIATTPGSHIRGGTIPTCGAACWVSRGLSGLSTTSDLDIGA